MFLANPGASQSPASPNSPHEPSPYAERAREMEYQGYHARGGDSGPPLRRIRCRGRDRSGRTDLGLVGTVPRRRRGKRFEVLSWIVAAEPLLLDLCLYVTCLVALAVLGHPPRSSLDDPKFISPLVDAPFCATFVLLLLFPFSFIGCLFLAYFRVLGRIDPGSHPIAGDEGPAHDRPVARRSAQIPYRWGTSTNASSIDIYHRIDPIVSGFLQYCKINKSQNH